MGSVINRRLIATQADLRLIASGWTGVPPFALVLNSLLRDSAVINCRTIAPLADLHLIASGWAGVSPLVPVFHSFLCDSAESTFQHLIT